MKITVEIIVKVIPHEEICRIHSIFAIASKNLFKQEDCGFQSNLYRIGRKESPLIIKDNLASTETCTEKSLKENYKEQ